MGPNELNDGACDLHKKGIQVHAGKHLSGHRMLSLLAIKPSIKYGSEIRRLAYNALEFNIGRS